MLFGLDRPMRLPDANRGIAQAGRTTVKQILTNVMTSFMSAKLGGSLPGHRASVQNYVE